MYKDKVNVVFPCAGEGSRFGHVFKPALFLENKTFIENSVKPFLKWASKINKFYFVITQKQEKKYSAKKKLESIFKNDIEFEVLVLNQDTKGPVETIVKANIEDSRSLIICDCDHSINVDNLFSRLDECGKNIKLLVPTYDIEGLSQKDWSKIIFVNNKIHKFVNKEIIDTKVYNIKGIIGCHFFKSFDTLKAYAKDSKEFFEVIERVFKDEKSSVEFYNVEFAEFYGDYLMMMNCLLNRWEKNKKLRAIKDLSENSLAKTFLLENQDEKFVRKIIFKGNTDSKHYKVLKRQYTDLNRINFLKQGMCPNTIREVDNSLFYYYDMQYLEDYQILSLINEASQCKMLKNTIDEINSNLYSMSRSINGDVWLQNFLEEKINPKFEMYSKINKSFDKIINDDFITVNNKKIMGLKHVINTIKYDNIKPEIQTVVHGDLTLENILVNPQGDLKVIDMDGSRIFDARELDLGKLSQSIIGCYASWKRMEDDRLCKVYDNRFDICDKFLELPETSIFKTLIDCWSKVLNVDNDATLSRAIFFMSTYFIRFVPFRLKISEKHGIFALLMAVVWLNKLEKR
jgi:thiamine kinase-like enzyme